MCTHMVLYSHEEQHSPISTPPVVSAKTNTKERRQPERRQQIKKRPRQAVGKQGRERTTQGLHGDYTTPRRKMKGVKTMSANEMTAKVRELKELKTMIDELSAEVATIEDEIKAEMTARNVNEMAVDVFKIRYTTVNSTRFDSSAFKKAHGDLYAQFSKQTTSRRFSIV